MSMRVTRLSVTPIKGLALHHPSSVDVDASGVIGDRIFYLVDDADVLVSISRTGGLVGLLADYDDETSVLTIRDGDEVLAEGRAESGSVHEADFFSFRQVPGRLAPGPWDAVFSARAGRALRLVRAAETGHDVEPLTLLGDASTARLSEQAGSAVDSRRFRMLIEFGGAEAHAEDGWAGQQMRIGDVVVEVGDAVQRCAGTTRNPLTGDIDLRTLTLIGQYRGRQDSVFGLGFNFGVYARCVAPGTVRVGDELELL
ncbi:MAG: MOSC domain-containing protein [Actinobacteria bacterium]|nr:MOSC domain-containing protein [Actinomycetota bacterium]